MFNKEGNRCANTRSAQQGAVLIVGLIILLLMTMVGVTAMQVTTQQERMAGNLRDRNVAFQAAEIALRAGEQDANTRNPFTCAGCYVLETTPAPLVLSDTTQWSSSIEFPPAPADGIQGTANKPRYMLEHLGVQGGLPQSSLNMGSGAQVTPKGDAIRVSAYGVGGRNDTVVILQSTYIRAYFN